jgi:hypothetical protein
MSLIYITKSIGPRALPCGIPLVTFLKVMDEWTKILDKGGKIDSVYIDFMKAFDKVPHRRLLHKMHRYILHKIFQISIYLSKKG